MLCQTLREEVEKELHEICDEVLVRFIDVVYIIDNCVLAMLSFT